jgi:hypothetical protein
MAVTMATRASAPWFWRDLRLVYVLLVWVAFAFGLYFYFDNDLAPRREARVTPAMAAAQAAKDDALYTGSIIVVPRTGEQCWKMMLDNRTGRMWESGYVDCTAAVGPFGQDAHNKVSRAGRLHAIGAAFRDGK